MSDAVIITLITVVVGGVLAVWVESIRTRRAVGQNGGSTLHTVLGETRSDVAEVKTDVAEIRKTQAKQGERIAALEARGG